MSEKIIYAHDGTVARVLNVENPNDLFSDFSIETFEDVEPLIESTKRLRENHRSRGDMVHVAAVPVTVVERAMREGWFHDKREWAKWCNDSQNRPFRVWEGNC